MGDKLGKEGPEQTTTYERQPLPGSEWGYGQALDYWNALMSGQGAGYPGALLSPWEQGAIRGYGGALESMWGQPGMFGTELAAPGGLFGEAQTAMRSYLTPEYLDVAADPNWQNVLQQQQGQIGRQMSLAGMDYGTPSQEALTRGSADLFLQESARRQNLQAGLSQWGQAFPLEAMQQFMPMAALPFARNYGEFLRQVEQSNLGGQMLGQLALGGAGQPLPTTVSQGGDAGWIGDLLQLYTMINPGWLPFVGGGSLPGTGGIVEGLGAYYSMPPPFGY